jgi:dihydroorotase
MFDNTELETLIQCMAISPRELLGVQVPVVEHQQAADLFFYNPDEEFTFTKEQLRSKSKNSPFIGKTLKGKIYGVSTNSGCTISDI